MPNEFRDDANPDPMEDNVSDSESDYGGEGEGESESTDSA